MPFSSSSAATFFSCRGRVRTAYQRACSPDAKEIVLVAEDVTRSTAVCSGTASPSQSHASRVQVRSSGKLPATISSFEPSSNPKYAAICSGGDRVGRYREVRMDTYGTCGISASRPSGPYQAPANGVPDKPCGLMDIEFLHDARPVGLRSFRTDVQKTRAFFRRLAFGHELKNLPLPRSKRVLPDIGFRLNRLEHSLR